MMTKILLTFTAFISIKAFAGTETHGGNLLICQENGKTIKEVLDFHEGKRLFKATTDMGEKNMPWLDQVKYVLNRLAKIDPVTAERYLKRASSFEQEMKLIPNDEIKKIKDNTSIVDYPNCKKIQLAAQIVRPNVGMFRYLINKDYYPNLPEFIKAQIALHEIVLTDPIENKLTDSDSTREFVFQISSTLMNNIDPRDYFEMTKRLFEQKIPEGLFSIKKFNAVFKMNNNFNADDKILSGDLKKDFSVKFENAILIINEGHNLIINNKGEILSTSNTSAKLYPKNANATEIKSFQICEASVCYFRVANRHPKKINGQEFEVATARGRLDENGNLIGITIEGNDLEIKSKFFPPFKVLRGQNYYLILNKNGEILHATGAFAGSIEPDC
jgi:hypothetical protein